MSSTDLRVPPRAEPPPRPGHRSANVFAIALSILEFAARSLSGAESLDILPTPEPFDTPYTILFQTDTIPVYIEGIRRRVPKREPYDPEDQELVELRISEDTFDRATFGRKDDEAAFFRRKDGSLVYRIYLLGRRYKLNAAQKKQLLLAGRGDLERLRNRVTALRGRFGDRRFVELPRADTAEAWIVGLIKDAKELRQELAGDAFPEGSLLTKALRRQLTPEQLADYEQSKPAPRAVP